MKGRSKFLGQMIIVSKTQIDLALKINDYRKSHNLSQKEMARICTLYGENHGVKFNNADICAYENLTRAPHAAKYNVLCNVLN